MHEVVETLNQILPRVARSLAVYLADAPPWLSDRQHRLGTVLAAVAADQRHYADRLAGLILQHGGQPDLGRFPMAFSDLHDLAADHVLARLACQQQADLAAVTRLAQQLPEGSAARELADEIRGNLQAHLDILEALR